MFMQRIFGHMVQRIYHSPKLVNVTVFWDEDDKKRNIEAVGFSKMSPKMIIYIAI